jgi:hypothetical protein
MSYIIAIGSLLNIKPKWHKINFYLSLINVACLDGRLVARVYAGMINVCNAPLAI